MDPATLIGIALAVVSLLIMMIMEGSEPDGDLPAAGDDPRLRRHLRRGDRRLLHGRRQEDRRLVQARPAAGQGAAGQRPIATLVSLAEKARKEGLLALEAQVKDIDDPFLKRGLQMGIDGTDPEELRTVLEGEIAAKKGEDKVAAKFFNAMGGYAPTIGIIGTVVGLIHVLENLDKPESLGPLIAGAFVATLWGVLSANIFWLPMGAKILRISELQAAQMELLVEGITEIQAGTSPRAVRQKLTALVPPSEVAREAA